MKALLTILFLLLGISSHAATYANNYTTNAAPLAIGNGIGLTNAAGLTPTFIWSTNTAEDKTRIYVTGTVTPSAARGLFVREWISSDGFMARWTNAVTPTHTIMLNRSYDTLATGASFIITDGTNSNNTLASLTQISTHPSSGSITFWENPLDTDIYGTAFYGGEATLTWATNNVITNSIRFLGIAPSEILPTYFNTNRLFVATNGDDSLANRTNGWPFRTIWAANQAAKWGDTIEVLEGFHRTTGMHMTRGVHIVGQGLATVVQPETDLDFNHDTLFQSAAISISDNCSVENLVITNGCILFAQTDGDIKGGTNGLAKDLWIYPAYLSVPYSETVQAAYFGYGVKFSRLGTGNVCQRVKIYTSAIGFDFQSAINSGLAASSFDLIDCEVNGDPRWLGTNNYWFAVDMLGFDRGTNIGGIIPIAFSCGSPAAEFNYSAITVNVIGGRFISMNGSTNAASYVGGENNISRNAGIWFARGHTNLVRVNLVNDPEFVLGNTNTTVQFILNETTNNNVTVSGAVQVKFVANGNVNDSGTNTLHMLNGKFAGDGNSLTNVLDYQAVYGDGTAASVTGSLAVMDFGTTDPQLTVTKSGFYELKAGAMGFTTADSVPCNFAICTNNAAVLASVVYVTGPQLGGAEIPFTSSPQTVYAYLAAGDTVSLQWQGTSYVANSAFVSILRIK